MFLRHLTGSELTEYADGEMGGRRRLRAQQHLSRCERCTQALEAAWQVVGVVRTAPAPAAPADLRQRIAAKLSEEPIRPLPCSAAMELIQEGLDGMLSPLSAGMLRLHVEHCPSCARQQRTLVAAARAVRSLEPVAAPAGIWEKAVARRQMRPAVSWGTRLRPAIAAAALAAGALIFGLQSLPRGSHQVAAVPPAQQRVARAASQAAPSVPRPAPAETAQLTQAARAGNPVMAPVRPEPAPATRARGPRTVVVAVAPRPQGVVRPAMVESHTLPAPPAVTGTTSSREEAAPAAVIAVAQPRRSRGLQALAMMAKAVSSGEGRVSLTRQLEPWQVTNEEAVSEIPLSAVSPATAPGAAAPVSPRQPNTGASEGRPGWAGIERHTV